jgi:outer membrane receptor for ferrienterochelin and colicins
MTQVLQGNLWPKGWMQLHLGSYLVERSMILKVMTHQSYAGKPARLATLGAFSTLTLSVALALGSLSGVAHAQQAATQIQIQSQPLAKALLQLGEQAGLQIFFAQDVVEGFNAPATTGNLTADQALQQLLQGTGITFTREGRTVTLSRPASQTSSNDATLGTVVVTAAGFEQQIKDAPASISVITRDDLTNKSYKDVNDALRDVPGVIVSGGDRPDISLRGMGTSYTLILVDGKRQNSRETRPNSDGAGVEGGWTPPVTAIERVEVVRGPMSSLYGSDAMGGVINIITRKVPTEWHGEVRTEATLQENSKSGNAYQSNFYLAGPLKSELLGLQVYGQQSKRVEDNIFGGFRGSDAQNLSAKLSLTPNKQHDLVLAVTKESQEGIESLGRSVNPLTPRAANSPFDYTSSKWSLSHTGRWGVGVSETYVQQEDYKNYSRDIRIKNTNLQSSLTASVLERHMLTLGTSYLKQDLTDNANKLAPQQRYQWALFIEDEWSITDTFALTAGVRMDRDHNFGSHYSPRLYGVWHAADNWTVKGGVSTGFKTPGIRQTVAGLSQESRGGNIYGNPDLKPETSVSQELGVLYDNPAGFNAGLTIFNNDFKDKITRVTCASVGNVCATFPNNGNPNSLNLNVDEANTRGVEGSLRWAFAPAWHVSASYTYTKSEQKSGQFKGKPLNKLPKHMVTSSLGWKPTDALDVWARVKFQGEESEPTTGQSASTIMAPSSTILDLGATYAVNKTITVYAGIYNLFDKEVKHEQYDYVEDGRRYWLGIGAKF